MVDVLLQKQNWFFQHILKAESWAAAILTKNASKKTKIDTFQGGNIGVRADINFPTPPYIVQYRGGVDIFWEIISYTNAVAIRWCALWSMRPSGSFEPYGTSVRSILKILKLREKKMSANFDVKCQFEMYISRANCIWYDDSTRVIDIHPQRYVVRCVSYHNDITIIRKLQQCSLALCKFRIISKLFWLL